LKIERETFDRALFDEILPLAQKCWQESTAIKADTCAFYGDREFQIEPDYDAYQKIEDAGSMVVITVRELGKLVGYLLGFSYRAMHHKHIIGGIADTMYLEPDHRTYAPIVAARFEKEMKDMGVGIIGWPTHENGPTYALLKTMGYVGDDVVMEKRLGV
jgi:hypothetical protein